MNKYDITVSNKQTGIIRISPLEYMLDHDFIYVYSINPVNYLGSYDGKIIVPSNKILSLPMETQYYWKIYFSLVSIFYSILNCNKEIDYLSHFNSSMI